MVVLVNCVSTASLFRKFSGKRLVSFLLVSKLASSGIAVPGKVMQVIKQILGRSWSNQFPAQFQSSVSERQDKDTSLWANIPQEMLIEIIRRIEDSESKWPDRRSVVACAGVCRSWRLITKELVKVPEISGKFTFPISVKQPGPRDVVLQCFIKRCRASQTYCLYLSLTNALAADGKFLLAARRIRHLSCTDFIISLDDDDISKESTTYVGKLRSNFVGTKFTVYDSQSPCLGAKLVKSRSTRLVNLKRVSPRIPSGNYHVATVSYDLNVLGSRGPRRMQCVMDAIPASSIGPNGVAPTQMQFSRHNIDLFPSFTSLNSKSNRLESFLSGRITSKSDDVLTLKNKSPRWHEQLQCWCLNFHGRVTVASVKNFQLVASSGNITGRAEHEKIILQFGKVGKDLFTMDYRYPLSAFQAFAISLSSFDTKIACE